MGGEVDLDNYYRVLDKAQAAFVKARNILAIVERPTFMTVWCSSSKEDQDAFLKAIETLDHNFIASWKKLRKKELCEQTITDLRQIAKRHRIINYSRKDKGALIRELQKRGLT